MKYKSILIVIESINMYTHISKLIPILYNWWTETLKVNNMGHQFIDGSTINDWPDLMWLKIDIQSDQELFSIGYPCWKAVMAE